MTNDEKFFAIYKALLEKKYDPLHGYDEDSVTQSVFIYALFAYFRCFFEDSLTVFKRNKGIMETNFGDITIMQVVEENNMCAFVEAKLGEADNTFPSFKLSQFNLLCKNAEAVYYALYKKDVTSKNCNIDTRYLEITSVKDICELFYLNMCSNNGILRISNNRILTDSHKMSIIEFFNNIYSKPETYMQVCPYNHSHPKVQEFIVDLSGRFEDSKYTNINQIIKDNLDSLNLDKEIFKFDSSNNPTHHNIHRNRPR